MLKRRKLLGETHWRERQERNMHRICVLDRKPSFTQAGHLNGLLEACKLGKQIQTVYYAKRAIDYGGIASSFTFVTVFSYVSDQVL